MRSPGYSVSSYTSPAFISTVRDLALLHGHYGLVARKTTDSSGQQRIALEHMTESSVLQRV